MYNYFCLVRVAFINKNNIAACSYYRHCLIEPKYFVANVTLVKSIAKV